MDNGEEQLNGQPHRLCSEIKLFELCKLDCCRHKAGRFCTNKEMLNSFEKIAEDDVLQPQAYIDDKYDFEDSEEYDDFEKTEFWDETEDDRDY